MIRTFAARLLLKSALEYCQQGRPPSQHGRCMGGCPLLDKRDGSYKCRYDDVYRAAHPVETMLIEKYIKKQTDKARKARELLGIESGGYQHD